MTDLLQDMRFGFRTFKRRPAFTLSALLILIVGIGSSTAIFSVVNQVLLAPLPYRAPQRLVRIFGTWDRGAREGISPPDFEDYRRRSRLLQSVAAAGNSTPLVSLKAGGEPEQIPSRNVTSGFFSTLGITPLFGREFLPEEEAWRGPRVAILSFGLWRRQFGADTTIVGRSFSINGVPYTAVGVLPPFFNFIGAADLFTPLQSNPVPEMRGIRTLTVIGRLRDRIDVNQAQNELDAVSRGLQEENVRFDRGWSVTLAPLAEEVVKDVKPALLALLAAVGLLVLLVAANVASLVLAEAATRRGEICLRLSLGASQARVVRQLLTESVMLALAGGAGGCVVARWMLGLLKRFGPATIPRLAEVTLDLRVLAFALIVSTLVGILCGLEPAWRTHRQDLAESMKGARVFSQHVGVRDALVVLEVTVSVILLIGAGLLIQSVIQDLMRTGC